MSQQDILENILRQMAEMQSEITRLQAQLPLFTILNVNEPAQITADQNNYDPGDYDLIHLNSDASRTITGFTGGVEGRKLIAVNVGSNDIVLANNSASSSVGNRILNRVAGNYTMSTRFGVLMIYRSTVWRIVFVS